MECNIIFPNVWFSRREIFFQAHPDKKIFPSRHEQNWQLALPLAYKFKCGYLNEPLIYYVVRADSHSRQKRSYQEIIERFKGFEELLTYTLKKLNAPNETELLNFVQAKYLHKILVEAINHGDEKMIYDCYQKAFERNLNIFGQDICDIKFLLERYIFPKIFLQNKLAEVKNDISKLNDKLK